MHQRSLRLALCTSLFVLPLEFAYGHGGKYVGPTDTIPPNTGDGGGVTPPGGTGGPGTPGPITPGSGGAPTTGGTGKGPTTPGGTPSKGGSRGGYGKRPTTESGAYEQWEFWWEANDDAFIELKQRLHTKRITSAITNGIGRGLADSAAEITRLRGSDLSRIKAALLVALEGDDADVVDSAAIALARMTPAAAAGEVVATLSRVLAHQAKTAREAATLGLGIVGSCDAIPVLRELLLDTPAGRKATGQETEVEPMVRAFAAASLGLIGDPAVVEDLCRVLTDARVKADRDTKASAVRALGLVRGAVARVVPFLQQQLDDVALDRAVRAQLPIALAQQAERDPSGMGRAALPALVEWLASDKTDLDLVRSCAVAIGRMATIDDEEALAVLHRTATKARDEQTRHFAVMALAEIGRRDTDPALHAVEHKELVQFLVRELVQPRPITATPYGALALGVWARNPRVDKELLATAQEKLRETLDESSNPSFRAAIAVSLGLANAKEARDELQSLFVEQKNQVLRSYVSIGLGLLDADEAAAPLREALGSNGLDSGLRLQIARALGILGDRRAVPLLVENLTHANTFTEIGSTAQALGLIGDREAVEPLLGLLEDPKLPPLQRGFAAVGLGLLAEKSDLPWHAVFTVGSNYRAKTPALAEIFDIL
ncbi:MAG: HEAT repeat domain-containing protein [Planctomycetes bacterium]|nr:HEAT repeat domain-containing protein [Planctomycetota bacterium]